MFEISAVESCSFFLTSLYSSLEELSPKPPTKSSPNEPTDEPPADERSEPGTLRRDATQPLGGAAGGSGWQGGKSSSPQSPAQGESELAEDLRQFTASLSAEEAESSFYIRYAFHIEKLHPCSSQPACSTPGEAAVVSVHPHCHRRPRHAARAHRRPYVHTRSSATMCAHFPFTDCRYGGRGKLNGSRDNGGLMLLTCDDAATAHAWVTALRALLVTMPQMML